MLNVCLGWLSGKCSALTAMAPGSIPNSGAGLYVGRVCYKLELFLSPMPWGFFSRFSGFLFAKTVCKDECKIVNVGVVNVWESLPN